METQCKGAYGPSGGLGVTPNLCEEHLVSDITKVQTHIISLITQNREKLAIARHALAGGPFRVEAVPFSCKEIQADEVSVIARESARYAAQVLRRPVVKTDKGLFIEALKGFPGPYSHYIEERLDENCILRLMQGIENRRACFKEALALCQEDGEPVVFESVTWGRIAEVPSGQEGWPFDRIFVCDNDTRTLACYSDEDRAGKYSYAHWQRLVEFLSSNPTMLLNSLGASSGNNTPGFGGELIFSREEIQAAVQRLAKEVSQWVASIRPQLQDDIVAIPILRGGLVFFADLIRQLPFSVDVAVASSAGYVPGANLPANGPLVYNLEAIEARGKAVLLVDDICDSGRTLGEISAELKRRGAVAVKTVALVNQVRPDKAFSADWAGLQYQGNGWLFGYGMEDGEQWRNLPEIFASARPLAASVP